MKVYIATVVDNDTHIVFTDIKHSADEAKEAILGYIKGTINTAINNNIGVMSKDLDSDCPYVHFFDKSEYYGEVSMRDLNPNGDGYFPITSICRDDLEAKGFDTSEVSDETMQRLASKMADDYLEQLYWISLEIFAEYLGIPHKNESKDDDE